MPPLARSLHLGVAQVDPTHYQGWNPLLDGAENDAAAMATLAKSAGFDATVLVGPEATTDRFHEQLRQASVDLGRGDVFLLTFSGCGGEIPDTNSDEADPGNRERCWVLYDRQLAADEWMGRIQAFAAGVRVIVIADAGFSGTVTRALPTDLLAAGPGRGASRPKCLPVRQAVKVYRANAELYRKIQVSSPSEVRTSVRASVLILSAAQDNQVALDGEPHGLFTQTLLKVWHRGEFQGSYKKFRDTIAARMPATQTPNLVSRGKSDPAFLAQRPFTV
ncbi:MAG: caspase family protein [Verrucomicrobiales bacterium]|nr:caspase family protein [Verrucomicrobiales bacterium]